MLAWRHQGRLMIGTPNISRPTTAGNNSLRLSRRVLAGAGPLLTPRESAACNLQNPAALQHSCKQFFHEMYNIPQQILHRIGRRPSYHGPCCSTPSSIDSEKSARKKNQAIDSSPMKCQDTSRPISSQQTGKTHIACSNGA